MTTPARKAVMSGLSLCVWGSDDLLCKYPLSRCESGATDTAKACHWHDMCERAEGGAVAARCGIQGFPARPCG
eukprot:12935601-Prorocentrum_lima.AAC.1